MSLNAAVQERKVSFADERPKTPSPKRTFDDRVARSKEPPPESYDGGRDAFCNQNRGWGNAQQTQQTRGPRFGQSGPHHKRRGPDAINAAEDNIATCYTAQQTTNSAKIAGASGISKRSVDCERITDGVSRHTLSAVGEINKSLIRAPNQKLIINILL